MASKNNNDTVPLIDKIAYGFGISMAAVSGLMLFSRFWDAINDPIIGGLTDKTKWGRYRPWLLFAVPVTAIILMLTFRAHPDWTNTPCSLA